MANEKIGNKLKQLRLDASLTQKQVYELLKVPQSTFSSWEIGKSEPDAITFLKLCEIYKVNNILAEFSDAVILPNTNEFAVTEKEKKHIKKYRSIDNFGMDMVDTVIDKELQRCTASKKVDNVHEEQLLYNVIPLKMSEYRASAGCGAYLGPEAFTTIMVEKNDLTKIALFAIPVVGDSMKPTYRDRDILLVERADELRKGEIGIFTLDGEGYVKMCGDGELISLNKKYEPIPMNESILLNGRVIGILKPEWIAE